MEDGTFDELRKQIVERVKQDVCYWTALTSSLRLDCRCRASLRVHVCMMQEALNAFIEEAVFNSKALASTKADSKGRQGDVYNSVRKEIEYDQL